MDAPIDRLSAGDLMQRAMEVGPLPMHIGAVLVLTGGDPAAVRAALGERVPGVARLRRRLMHTAPGCGRPVWVDDAAFDIARHVTTVECEAPGDEEALLRTALPWYTTPLPPDRPLWRAVVVTGLRGGEVAMVLVLHHVLADGIGGLAVLTSLVDGGPTPAAVPFPTPVPSRRALAADAWSARLRAGARVRAGVRGARAATTELGRGRPPKAEPCSLLRPLHAELRIALTRVDLAALRGAAKAHGATINDAVLVAVTGALRDLLARRGEQVSHLVVSVPVTGRPAAAPEATGATGAAGTAGTAGAAGATGKAEPTGNQVGIMPVRLRTAGEPLERLVEVAAHTRARKGSVRGSSAAISGPVFRLLGSLGVLRWLVRHQRMVTTFVTNVRGPEQRPSFAGAVVADVIPLGIVSGNVTVAFTVFSYAGTLTVAIAADPTWCTDLDVLRDLLQAELDDLAGGAEPRSPTDGLSRT
jgi:WS/DGAT/MGAT family acyltransferase